jgi:hypothetical protein
MLREWIVGMNSVSESWGCQWLGLQDLVEKVFVFVRRGLRVDVEGEVLTEDVDRPENPEYQKEVEAIGR